MKQEDATAQLSGNAVTRQLVLDEINMEICMRERLQETVESRIAWATCLQSSLGAVVEKGSGTMVDIPNANPFQFAAAEALNVAEAPLLPILSREARFPTAPTPNIAPPPSATSSTNPYARPYARHTRLRRSPSTIHTSPKLLYFRDASTNSIARLLCPDCSRGDFPRVQSLLNHCRIQHGREFGSHDDCIRGCAVHVPVDEEAWVIENGSELRQGGLPSLRRLFEIAVGSTGTSLEIASANGTSTAQPNISQEDSYISEQDSPRLSAPLPNLSSTHLSRTLGHHADSPALAPFLGRAAKRRGIVVHDENTPVDIDSGGHSDLRQRWYKPFIHRSRARPALDVEIPAETPIPQYTPNVIPIAQGTRFHIVARVTISDRSLWIPIDQRSTSSPDHTHKWLLCIEAPSYSLPLGAILDRVSVTCLSPGTSPVDEPLEMSGPPFVASGTTARPFLARLRLEWTSGSLNPPLEVDHWVELDALHAGSPVLGDEQVLDVELDRHTVFLPTAKHTQGSDLGTWDHGYSRVQPEPASTLPGYVVLLRLLVPKFPLTLRDMKSSISAPLPYKRVSSPAQFRALVPGRRKAMEWARARALREAYEKLREEKAPGEDYPHLSTGDVFSWLADTGLSLRQAVHRSAPANSTSGKRPSERITPSAPDTFCPVCGVEQCASEQSSSWEGLGSGSCCHSSPILRLPLLDVDPVACAPSQLRPNGPVRFAATEDGTFRWSIREILMVTDPALVFAVHCIIGKLKLSSFPEFESGASVCGAGVLSRVSPNGTASTPGDDITIRPDLVYTSGQVSDSLGSCAVLALAVREFARCLMDSAITAFASDRAREIGSPRVVLSPAHVCRGVAGSFLTRGVFAELPDSPVALALATLVEHPPRDPPVIIASSKDTVSVVHS